VGKTKNCCLSQQSTCPKSSKTDYSWSSLKHSAKWISTNLLKSVQKKSGMSHSKGQTFCDDESNINYYTRLIINKRSKQCVLLVPNAHKDFSRQVIHCFRRKLPMVKSEYNQSAPRTLCILKQTSFQRTNVLCITRLNKLRTTDTALIKIHDERSWKKGTDSDFIGRGELNNISLWV
jgi:hypothetical protein